MIVQQPPNLLNQIPGENVQFRVNVTGDQLTYQWLKDGEELSDGLKYTGSTTNVLTVMNIEFPLDEGTYRVIIRNTVGNVSSNSAELNIGKFICCWKLNNSGVKYINMFIYVVTVPVITMQPTNKQAQPGDNVTFSAIATGELLRYQWQKDGANLSDISWAISGTQTSNLTIYDVMEPEDEGAYTLLVFNIAGSDITGGAALEISK